MPLHFDRKEFSKRLDRLKVLMSWDKLDGILLFRQESMFYLTGYDTCLLYTSPSPRDLCTSRMPSSA